MFPNHSSCLIFALSPLDNDRKKIKKNQRKFGEIKINGNLTLIISACHTIKIANIQN